MSTIIFIVVRTIIIKKILIFGAVFLFVAPAIFCQNVIFTNQNLKTYLLTENTVDSDGDEFADSPLNLNNDGEIQLSEALSVQNLVIAQNDLQITSIYDLHQFTNLERLGVYGECGLIDISNLGLLNLVHIRISDHNSIRTIDLSDLPNLNSIFIEGLNGLESLNIQNGSLATENFSLFYTYFNSACVDDIQAEYDLVALNMLNDNLPQVNCALGIEENLNHSTAIFPNPVMDVFTIKTQRDITGVKVFNLVGKVVFKSELSHKSFNIEYLEPGLYILAFETSNGLKFQHKLIKK